MVEKTAREIIKNAKFLAGIRNSEITNFYSECNLLNNVYQEIYTDICKDYVNYAYLENGDTLPNDCYLVEGVYNEVNGEFIPFKNTSRFTQSLASDEYKIENGKIFFNKRNCYKKLIKYYPIPITLTAPDEAVEIKDTITKAGDIDENYFYYLDGDGDSYAYNINTNSIEDGLSFKEKKPIPKYTFSNNTIYLGDKVILENVAEASYSEPYYFISFSDGSSYIYTDLEEEGTYFNYYCIQGKSTNGKILNAYTDISTGKGVVFYNSDNNKYYYMSFVPDTVLSYPKNIYFTILEYKLAIIFASLNNQDTSQLQLLLKQAQNTFAKTDNVDDYMPYRLPSYRGMR